MSGTEPGPPRIRGGPYGATLNVVDIDLAILVTVAVVWLAAGIVADGLPDLGTALALRRRAGLLIALAATGLAVMAGVAVVALATTEATTGRVLGMLALPAVPAAVVAGTTMRRLLRLRRGAGALAAAPHTPAPPALRAGAAHPMIGTPLQVAGLIALPAPVSAAGAAELTGAAIGLLLTGAVLAVTAIGVRHALRHSRLTERAVAVLPPRRPGDDSLARATAGATSPHAVGVLHV